MPLQNQQERYLCNVLVLCNILMTYLPGTKTPEILENLFHGATVLTDNSLSIYVTEHPLLC